MGNWNCTATMRVTILLCLFAAMTYMVIAEPQPKPILGFGLLGRLLTAVASGDKEKKDEGKREQSLEEERRRRTREEMVEVTKMMDTPLLLLDTALLHPATVLPPVSVTLNLPPATVLPQLLMEPHLIVENNG